MAGTLKISGITVADTEVTFTEAEWPENTTTQYVVIEGKIYKCSSVKDGVNVTLTLDETVTSITALTLARDIEYNGCPCRYSEISGDTFTLAPPHGREQTLNEQLDALYANRIDFHGETQLSLKQNTQMLLDQRCIHHQHMEA